MTENLTVGNLGSRLDVNMASNLAVLRCLIYVHQYVTHEQFHGIPSIST